MGTKSRYSLLAYINIWRDLLLSCLRDKAKIAPFFKIIELLLWFKAGDLADPRARQRSKNTTPGATKMCESPGSLGGGGGGDGQAWKLLNIKASPITATASYRSPINSCSSSENSSFYLASKKFIFLNTDDDKRSLNSYADALETPETPSSQELGSSDRCWGKWIKRKKAQWENQHENVALIDSWKTHFRALSNIGFW